MFPHSCSWFPQIVKNLIQQLYVDSAPKARFWIELGTVCKTAEEAHLCLDVSMSKMPHLSHLHSVASGLAAGQCLPSTAGLMRCPPRALRTISSRIVRLGRERESYVMDRYGWRGQRRRQTTDRSSPISPISENAELVFQYFTVFFESSSGAVALCLVVFGHLSLPSSPPLLCIPQPPSLCCRDTTPTSRTQAVPT